MKGYKDMLNYKDNSYNKSIIFVDDLINEYNVEVDKTLDKIKTYKEKRKIYYGT